MSNVAKLKKKAADFEQKKQFDKALAIYVQVLQELGARPFTAINAARERDMLDLDRQKGDNDRQLRFALARGGQIGGSTQRDQQQTLGEDYTRGLLNVESRAQGLGADLSSRDQDARARLISLATSGLDATTGASQAAAAMKSNLEGAQSAAYGQNLGDSFGTVGSFIKESKDAAQRRRANQDAYGRIGLYGGTQGYGG